MEAKNPQQEVTSLDLKSMGTGTSKIVMPHEAQEVAELRKQMERLHSFTSNAIVHSFTPISVDAENVELAGKLAKELENIYVQLVTTVHYDRVHFSTK